MKTYGELWRDAREVLHMLFTLWVLLALNRALKCTLRFVRWIKGVVS